MKVFMAQDLLKANIGAAERNRTVFNENGNLVLNLIGSPGAGKTVLLEKTLEGLAGNYKTAVVEGDVYTTRDAERLEKKGAEVVQINTAGGCHLEAGMVTGILKEISLQEMDFIFIENVGNLVCPAEFDLGEELKVVVLSVTEGGDKPSKYPLIFREAQVCIINKMDLLSLTDFDLTRVKSEIKDINGSIQVFLLCATSGEGTGEWVQWLRKRRKKKTDPVTE